MSLMAAEPYQYMVTRTHEIDTLHQTIAHTHPLSYFWALGVF